MHRSSANSAAPMDTQVTAALLSCKCNKAEWCHCGALNSLWQVFHSGQQEAQSAPPMSGQPSDYVKVGSKEFKHEWKKANDRLYKRQKRQGQPNNIQRQEVEDLHMARPQERQHTPDRFQPGQPRQGGSGGVRPVGGGGG